MLVRRELFRGDATFRKHSWRCWRGMSGAFSGRELFRCHDDAASWPGETAKFRLLARGSRGSLNELLHVLASDSRRGCDAWSSSPAMILLHASSGGSLQRPLGHAPRISAYPHAYKRQQFGESLLLLALAKNFQKRTLFLCASDQTRHGAKDQADRLFLKGDHHRGPEGRLFLCAGLHPPRCPR